MTATPLKQGNDQDLRRAFAAIASAIAETLPAVVGKDVVALPQEITRIDPSDLLAEIRAQAAVVRGALEKDFAGRTLRIFLDARDATSLAGLRAATPEQAIKERREKGTLEGEELESFGEVAKVLCSGIDGKLKEAVGAGIALRVQDHGVVTPGLDAGGLLGNAPLVSLAFKLKVADLPEADAAVLVDLETAEKWNKKPLEWAVGDASGAAAEPSAAAALDDNEIPAAPIRARLAAFTVEQETLPVLRKSCRRVGLELDRRGRGEVPNPAAHKDQIVLIEVPINDDRRFDWCKRLKNFNDSIKVVLLLHHPSRARVTLGFVSKADAIVAWPVNEALLSQKLGTLASALASAK